ncbi:hypothetical protein GGS21DRAFT_350250 [Xylaria nigripes]|nr:hypothetical protein GGS21DRAFT_350250 [Xylaria nigripes]
MQSPTLPTSLLARLTRINTRHIRHQQQILANSSAAIRTICQYHTAKRPRAGTKTTILSRGGRHILRHASAMSTETPPSIPGPSAPKCKKTPPEPSPSASIMLLSPTNQVLLLRRVKTSTSFASAHVFPGGNLSEFHDGPVPLPNHPGRHHDSLAYRLGAIRETFEESGILLARKGDRNGPMLNLPTAERNRARKAIYENKISFTRWVESVGGVVDTENLRPFTRWITPPGPPKRFTTQMYVYMMPLETDEDADPVVSAARQEALIPTADGGTEVMTAHFDDAVTWLNLQRRGEITLFPPQYFLLHLMAQCLTGAPIGALDPDAHAYYHAQRERLIKFLEAVPTSSHHAARNHPTSHIPWGEKVISPAILGIGRDGRAVLGLDKPGAELRGTGRGGDWERVVLVRFGNAGPVGAEVRGREEAIAEVREAKVSEGAKL